MILPAGGIVRSCPIAKSTLARTRSPGRTLSRPAPRARIFSVIVIPTGKSVPQPFRDPVAALTGRQVATKITRTVSRADGGFDRTLDRCRHVRMAQVFNHHRSAQNGPDRIDDPAARDVRSGAVHRLEQAAPRSRVDVCRRRYPHAADQLSGQVGKDVAKQVASDDDVELARALPQLPRGRIDAQAVSYTHL